MVVNPLNNSSSNVFTLNSSSTTTASNTKPDFESELTAALAQTLSKVAGGSQDIQITVRNGGGLRREIVISYDDAESSATQPQTTTGTENTRTNPFSGSPSEPSPAPAATPATINETPWSPYSGPADRRDAIPAGGGKVTATGAPMIELNAQPASNQYGYTGLAARNPYFTTPSNPQRDGYVAGYQNWFQDNYVVGGNSGPAALNQMFHASPDGANEALRLVQQYVPDAKIVSSKWEGGIFSMMKETLFVELPGGQRLNAGAVVHSYYQQGRGVTAYSDTMLEQSIRQA
jgi:hypothetical protein